MLFFVHDETSDLYSAALFDIGAAEQSAHAQKKFVHIERLGDIIVRAEAESPLFGGQIAERGHEYHGNIFIRRAHFFRKLESVLARHHDVAHDDIELFFAHLFQRSDGGKTARRCVAPAFQ